MSTGPWRRRLRARRTGGPAARAEARDQLEPIQARNAAGQPRLDSGRARGTGELLVRRRARGTSVDALEPTFLAELRDCPNRRPGWRDRDRLPRRARSPPAAWRAGRGSGRGSADPRNRAECTGRERELRVQRRFVRGRGISSTAPCDLRRKATALKRHAFVITSPERGDGKTTVAANLARAVAQAGQSRRPSRRRPEAAGVAHAIRPAGRAGAQRRPRRSTRRRT